MITDKLTYLVVENAPDVCEGIIRRMSSFEKWQSIGYCMGVREAMEKINLHRPHLIFLDWSLNGGSAFEILQQIQNTVHYNPYIIFNTGFQKDNPEIPQEIINNYKVDKYLVKPLWENLRNNLSIYLREAEEKQRNNAAKTKALWLEDVNGHTVLIELSKLICICQHPTEQRSRNVYLSSKDKEVTIAIQWQKCYDLLKHHEIDFFITKTRSHLVVKEYVEKFEKPFVRLKGLTAFKIDVVKESIKDFEKWLLN